MIFSKSFGYAVRGVLYISLQGNERHVQVKEIASVLAVPRHFMGKILKRLAKESILSSVKGPSGGFTTNEHTMKTPLIRLLAIMEGLSTLETCTLKFNKCSSVNPCPLHFEMEKLRKELEQVLSANTIDSLVTGDKAQLLKSITTIPGDKLIEREIIQTLY
jgi:Rrf2 family transcriptional regulator, iron-sulfur cluster assembly transcription factor